MAEVLTVEEFAADMRISRSLAYKLVASGDVPAVRLGKAWRIPRHVVDQLLNEKPLDRAPKVQT